MKPQKLLLLIFLFSYGVLYSQTDFRPGYIIKTNGDTIIGEIDYRGDLLMSSICKVRTAENAVSEYSPNDIIAYRYTDGKYYISRVLDDKNVFLEYLINGKVNIYYMRDVAGDHYYVDKKYMKLTELPFEEGIKHLDNKRVYYETTRHIGLLSLYMQDAPKIQAQIKSIRKPDHQNLIKLAEDYHNLVCQNEECIIYEKSAPLIQILPELLGGITRYSNIDDLNDKFYTQFGVIGHVRMPRTSEKLYFRTGLLFMRLNVDDEGKNIFKIPVQFEYIYPRGIFRPRIAYGFNFYTTDYRSVSVNLGSNIKLTENLFVSATSDIEFNSFALILPKDFLSYSLKLGVLVEF
jgi:hypothetical protein